MGAMRSCPPPPARIGADQRAKYLRRAVDAEGRDGTRDWFVDWCRDHSVSVRDLATILRRPVSVAQDKLTGKRGVTLQDIKRFPRRFRAELIHEFGAWCASNDNDSHS